MNLDACFRLTDLLMEQGVVLMDIPAGEELPVTDEQRSAILQAVINCMEADR